MTYGEYCNKLINKLILHGRKFVEYFCFRYGMFSTIATGEISDAYIEDYQYVVFTKSIKTLESIRALLKIGNVKDVLILLRTTFEGYLASRYIVDEFDKKFHKEKRMMMVIVEFMYITS